MRGYRFRGFRRKTQEWVYGYAVVRKDSDLDDIVIPIGDTSSVTYAVEKGSVGQYTGLKDNKCQEIYEGDIVKVGVCNLECKIYYSNKMQAFKGGKRRA